MRVWGALALAALVLAPFAAAAQSDLQPAFGSTVANRHWIAGSSVSLQLPAASGGDGAVSHALTGPGDATTLTLPQGLSWSAATRTISGTPAAAAAAASYNWTATDGDGDTAQLSFDITVAAANAPRPTSLALFAPAGFDGDYAAGEVIQAFVSFDRNVTVTGAPQLALDIGGVMRQAAWASGSSDADELSFHYTVTSSDFDGDGLAIGPDALTLNGGGIVDAGDSSVAASLGLAGLAIGGPSGRTVRDTRPVFSQAASAADRSLAKDVQTSTTLPLATGGDGALTYSVSPALPAGLTLASASPTVAGTPTAAGATTHTLTATDADGDRATLGPFTVTVVVVPGVSGVSIASSPASGSSYAAGENIDVAVSFSQAVTVTGSPRLALTVGSRTRQAAFRSVSGSTVNFRYTTVGGDRDSDGVSIAADALTLNGGGIGAGGVDAALGLGSHALGNQSGHLVDGGGPTFDGVASPALSFTRGSQGSFTLPAAVSATSHTTYQLAATPALPGGLSFSFGTRTLSGAPEVGMAKTTYTLNAYRLVPLPNDPGLFTEELVDTLVFTVAVSGAVPAVSGVSIASSPADGFSYATGEWIAVDVTFNYPVTVAGSPQLALGIGAATRQAEYVGVPGDDDGSRQRFRYRVTASDIGRDGIGIAAGALTAALPSRITAANLDVALGLGSHAIATAADHTVNDLRPSFGSTVANRHWIAGSSVSLQLPAASGGDATVSHALTGPGGATTLTLPQGLSWTAATRTISGTPAGVAAAASYNWTATDGDGDTAQLSFDITVAAANAPRPTGLALSAPVGFDGDYAAGEVIRAVVSFDRNVTVTGAPRLALDIGGAMRQAAYASGSSDADQLAFRYTVTSSDFDGDGLDIGSDALTLNGGGIADAGDPSLAASLGLAGLAIGGPSGRTVRDTRPVFSQAASAANRSLAKDVQTSTTLPLATGGDGALTYSVSPALPAGLTLASASPTVAGTPTAAGATTHTLTATDADGDRATLGPFTVTVVVMPRVTGVSIASSPASGSSYAAGENIDVAVAFSQAVTVTGSPRLALTVGSRTRQAAFRSVSGSTVNFRYTTVGGDRGQRRRLHRRGRADAERRRHRGGRRRRRPRPRQPRAGQPVRPPGRWRRSDLQRRGVAVVEFHAGFAGKFHASRGDFVDEWHHLPVSGDAGVARRPVLQLRDARPVGRAGGGDGEDDLHAQRLSPGPASERPGAVHRRARRRPCLHGRGVRGGSGGERGFHRLLPGGRLQLRHRRVDRGGRDLQLPGDGGRVAAAGARHRRRHAAGGVCRRAGRRRWQPAAIPLPGDGRRTSAATASASPRGP